MGRSKERAGSSKRKAVDSSQQVGEPQPPHWGRDDGLSTISKVWRAKLYKRKVEGVKNLFLGERKVTMEEFKNYGLTECFARLGWTQALLFNNDDQEEIYPDAIVEWMLTLERKKGTNPPRTMYLVGTMNAGKKNQKKVKLSIPILSRIANYDTCKASSYRYLEDKQILGDKIAAGENWRDMILTLFNIHPDSYTDDLTLFKNDLRPLPKLLLNLSTSNVIPRASDKMKVRHYEVRVLYALVTGRPLLSYRHLVLLNIWESHESSDRKSIPHSRLLSRMLKDAGVIDDSSRVEKLPHVLFNRKKLGVREYSFTITPTSFVLTDKKGDMSQEFPRTTPMDEDDPVEDEEENDDEEDGDDDDANEDDEDFDVEDEEDREYDRMDQGGARPVEYDLWTSDVRARWDSDQKFQADMRKHMAWQEEITRCKVYQDEKYYNNIFDFFEQERHRKDYMAGLPYVETSPWVDY